MIEQTPSVETVKNCAAPDPENVDPCRSIWYVGGKRPQKAVTMKAPEGKEVLIQIVRTGDRMDLPVAAIRKRNTWTGQPIEPPAETESN